MGTAEFPFGFMTQYKPSMLVGDDNHQSLAAGFPIGKRFKSATVVRVSDSNPVHLGHLAQADGRWRIYVFADSPPAGQASKLADFAGWLGSSPDSPLAWTPEGADEDAWFDVKVVYQQDHTNVALMERPRCSSPGSACSTWSTWRRSMGSTSLTTVVRHRPGLGSRAGA
ncbi:hypothetical protein [Tessaracoccus sp. Z1128]